MWKIEKVVKKGDYKYAVVPDHPNRTKNNYVLLHRVIVENQIGRLLTNDEIVHHKDGNKFNNDINNLEILSNSEHAKFHMNQHGRLYVKLKCPNCGNIFDIPKNKSFIDKHSQYTCCSTHCRGQLSLKIQKNGITPDIKEKIKNNLISVYRNFQNN